MLSETLTERVSNISHHIRDGDNNILYNNLDELRSLANADEKSPKIERIFSVFLTNRLDGIEDLLIKGDTIEAQLGAKELHGYFDGFKRARENTDLKTVSNSFAKDMKILEGYMDTEDENISISNIRYAEGIAAGIKLALNPATDHSNFEHSFEQSQVKVGDHVEKLSEKQNKLLKYLLTEEIKHYSKSNTTSSYVPLKRDEISKGAWSNIKKYSGLTYHMLKLQRTLESDPAKPKYIQKVHGNGYLFSSTPGKLDDYGMEYNPKTGKINISGITMQFSGKQKKFMNFLFERPNQIRSVEEISHFVWGKVDHIYVVKQMVGVLNDKLELEDMPPSIFGNTRIGYGLRISQSPSK